MKPELEALAAEDLVRITVDLAKAGTNATGVVPRIMAHREAIVRELPSFDISKVDKLSDYAAAMFYADAGAAPPKLDPAAQQLLDEGTELRARMLAVASGLAHVGLFDEDQPRTCARAPGTSTSPRIWCRCRSRTATTGRRSRAAWETEHPQEPGLPAIIPIVVHHGSGGWRGPTSLGEMYKLDAETRSALSAHLPELRFVLDDLGAISMAELEQRPMTDFGRLVLLCLQRARITPDMVRDLARWLEAIGRVLRRAGGRRAVGKVVRYILGVTATEPARVRALLEGAFGREGREAYMTGADVLRVEGQVRTLVRQLNRRFGKLDAALVSRLESASSEELDLIADRVITAPTLADVFSDRGDTPTG